MELPLIAHDREGGASAKDGCARAAHRLAYEIVVKGQMFSGAAILNDLNDKDTMIGQMLVLKPNSMHDVEARTYVWPVM